MQEVMVKTHLIVTDVHEEYYIDWCGKIKDVKPKLHNGYPRFILISGTDRLELDTIDIRRVEECAKMITAPRGRQAITTDTTRIYIEEEDGQRLMGTVTHNHIKQYQQMYDPVYKN